MCHGMFVEVRRHYNLQKSVLSFHLVGPRDPFQVTGFCIRQLFLLNHRAIISIVIIIIITTTIIITIIIITIIINLVLFLR